LHANGNAKPTVWRILDSPELLPYHQHSAILLGYLGDSSDVPRIEERVRFLVKRGGVGHGNGEELSIVARLLESLGLLCSPRVP
jgi:hypothetical protein